MTTNNSNEQAHTKPLDPRTIVVQAMHPSGVIRGMIGEHIWERAYLSCDGFGDLSTQEAEQQCWDWSHVRDSSDPALSKAAGVLLCWLAEQGTIGEAIETIALSGK